MQSKHNYSYLFLKESSATCCG